mgnify:CR=1 FL=1
MERKGRFSQNHYSSPLVANQLGIWSVYFYIFGSGLSVAAAALAEYSLTTLGFSALACLNGGVRQTLEVSQITERDLVMVIAIWRYMRHEVEAVKAARTAGAS